MAEVGEYCAECLGPVLPWQLAVRRSTEARLPLSPAVGLWRRPEQILLRDAQQGVFVALMEARKEET